MARYSQFGPATIFVSRADGINIRPGEPVTHLVTKGMEPRDRYAPTCVAFGWNIHDSLRTREYLGFDIEQVHLRPDDQITVTIKKEENK